MTHTEALYYQGSPSVMSLKSDSLSSLNRLQLPQVTLFAATSIALSQTIQALVTSSEHADFGAIKLFSHTDHPDRQGTGIDLIIIPELLSRQNYSRFMLTELADYINTQFMLCVQWDGFVVRPECWREEFLDYDYVGAVWPQFNDGKNVGNGGFSIRSAALMRATRDPRLQNDELEDIVIGRSGRTLLEKDYGIRFAPASVAEHLSFERSSTHFAEFGFHGVFNMRQFLGPKKFRELIDGLPPKLINRQDIALLLRQATRAGDLGLISSLVGYYCR